MKLPKEGNITLISIKKCGVTLVELMIVVAIIAIIVSIAYPSYQNHITKTRRADGQGMLLRVMQEQRKHFSNENTYTTDLIGDLGFDDSGDGSSVESEGEFYLITAGTCTEGGDVLAINTCVQLTATPTFSTSDSDDTLTYNSKNQ